MRECSTGAGRQTSGAGGTAAWPSLPRWDEQSYTKTLSLHSRMILRVPCEVAHSPWVSCGSWNRHLLPCKLHNSWELCSFGNPLKQLTQRTRRKLSGTNHPPFFQALPVDQYRAPPLNNGRGNLLPFACHSISIQSTFDIIWHFASNGSGLFLLSPAASFSCHYRRRVGHVGQLQDKYSGKHALPCLSLQYPPQQSSGDVPELTGKE